MFDHVVLLARNKRIKRRDIIAVAWPRVVGDAPFVRLVVHRSTVDLLAVVCWLPVDRLVDGWPAIGLLTGVCPLAVSRLVIGRVVPRMRR